MGEQPRLSEEELVARNETGVKETLRTFVIPKEMSILASERVIERAGKGETFWAPNEQVAEEWGIKAVEAGRRDLKFEVEAEE